VVSFNFLVFFPPSCIFESGFEVFVEAVDVGDLGFIVHERTFSHFSNEEHEPTLDVPDVLGG